MPPRIKEQLLRAEEEVELAQTMRRGKRATEWLARIEKEGPGATLEVDEELFTRADLEQMIQSGNDARWKFAQANQLLVEWAVRSPFRREIESMGVPTTKESLKEIAHDIYLDEKDGLLRAIDDFDPNLGYKFSTFAMSRLRRGCQQQIIARLPIDIGMYGYRELRQLRRSYHDPDYKHPRGDRSGFSNAIRSLGSRVFSSLNDDWTDSEGGRQSREELVGDPMSTVAVDAIDDHMTWESALDELNPEQRFIVVRGFGLDGEAPRSTRHLAQDLGIGVSTVRSHQQQAFAIIKPYLTYL